MASNKPFVPKETTKERSYEGPHGGDKAYHQAKISQGVIVHDAIEGHKQENTVPKKAIPGDSSS